MAFNLLRGRLPGQRSDEPPKLAIGEADAHVFNCPTCSRPLNDGTPKCPACGTRLIMGVAVRRAATLMGFGAIVGPVHRRHGHLRRHQGPHGPDRGDGIRPRRRGREAGRERGRGPARSRSPPRSRSRPPRSPPSARPRSSTPASPTTPPRCRGSPAAARPTTSPRSCARSRRTPPSAPTSPRASPRGRAARRCPGTAPPSTRRSPTRRTAAWAIRSRTPRRIAPTRRRCSRCSKGSARARRGVADAGRGRRGGAAAGRPRGARLERDRG